MQKLLKVWKAKQKMLSKKIAVIKKNKIISSPKTKMVAIIVAIAVIFGSLLFITKSWFVAALVNGQPITRIALVRALEAQGGQQTLDNLIEKSLIWQEANKNNVKVNQDVVDEEIKAIEATLTKQGITLDEALSSRGQTRNDLVDQIKLQKTVEQILAQKIVTTEEELKDYFDKNKDIFGTNVKYEDVKDKVRDQVYQTKLSEEYSKWMTEIKTKAKINYLLSF